MKDYKELSEKFELKGYDIHRVFIPFPPIFDPTYLQLLNYTKEEAYEKFKKDYNHAFKAYNKAIDYWNTWIDYQQHKFEKQ